ncbi:MAG: hypothetical protein KatS3mg082_2784 [Nitrospiraceae bacterium]|nr:MAG: hypothetical protein KatS3mg082_2784 [Nitrospiraceae bacterium]
MTGLGRFFAKAAPQVELILADPPLARSSTQYVNEGVRPESQSGSWTGGGHRRAASLPEHRRLLSNVQTRLCQISGPRELCWPAASCC